MTDRIARRFAWSAFVLWVLFFVASVAFDLAKGPTPADSPGSEVPFHLLVSTFVIVAILILARQPRNRIGWILMAIGLLWTSPVSDYGAFALSRGLPGGLVSVAISAPLWAPPVGLMGTVLLLRFPDGKLLSPRWRKVEWVALAAISMVVLTILIAPTDMAEVGYPSLRNPFGIDALEPVIEPALFAVLLPLLPLTILASAVSVVLRLRRSRGTERLQMKWLTTAAAVVAVTYLATMLASLGSTWLTSTIAAWVGVLQNLVGISFALIPISIGFAILKHRLYDIDVVINKALVYGALAAFITAVYVAIVVGIGSLAGTRGEPNLGLSIVATAVVAIAFQPARERVQRVANRLVYGKRATPYQVLADFAERVAGTYSAEDVLPRMARVLAEGTGAASSEVWLRADERLRLAAAWPLGSEDARTVELRDGELPAFHGASRAVAVRHRGELLGALTMTKPAGEAVTPAEDALLSDLASQAGLVLRNVELTEDLRARLREISAQAEELRATADELRASRQRLVSAQDEARRRIERDLHDGAQQRLVSLALALRMVEAEAGPEADPGVREGLVVAREELKVALQELRELARGIHPAVLTEQGLPAALEALAQRCAVPVTLAEVPALRLPAPVEAAGYFVVSEALANVAKYARATSAQVRARVDADRLVVEVRDDGVGGASLDKGSGLRGLADRVHALGGTLIVESPTGEGTRVVADIPCEPVPA